MNPKNIEEYVKVYENIIDSNLCKKTINELNKVDWTEHKHYNYSENRYVGYDNDVSECYLDTECKKIIQNKIWHVIEKYIIFDFKVCDEWWSSWKGYSELKFNKYEKNKRMRLHCDHIHSMFDGQRKGIPILSIVGCLNDNYEGGEFVMWDKIIKIPEGAVLVFPSNFMFPHKVNPVKKGVRYSFVSWVF